MDILILLFAFLFGLVVGSFLNAVIFRIHQGESLKGRSFCPFCRHQLATKDLVPILSFLLLGRKCRYCRKPISWQYPLVELFTALVFSFVAFQTLYPEGVFLSSRDNFQQLLFYYFFISLLVVIFVYDWKHYLIPDSMVVLGIAGAAIYRLVSPQLSFLDGLAGMIIISGFFGALYIFSRGKWIGLGDVKLGMFLGLLLGFSFSLLMLLIAYVSGALVGVFLIFKKQKSIKSTLPFGTFLAFATMIMMLWGKEILNWYLLGF